MSLRWDVVYRFTPIGWMVLAPALLLVGLDAVVTRKNIIKIIVGVLILGCTHFPILRPAIETVVDTGTAIVMGKHSGRAALRSKLKDLGYEMADNQLNDLFVRFKALADWFPCPSHSDENPDYDMYAFYWRAVMHCNSMTQQNPYLDECSQEDPYVYAIQMHRGTAAKKGIADGDSVWLENTEGHRVKGWVALTEGIGQPFRCFGQTIGKGRFGADPDIDTGRSYSVIMSAYCLVKSVVVSIHRIECF